MNPIEFMSYSSAAQHRNIYAKLSNHTSNWDIHLTKEDRKKIETVPTQESVDQINSDIQSVQDRLSTLEDTLGNYATKEYVQDLIEDIELIPGPKGDKGDDGRFEDLTPEEKASLKGDPFTYEDFTPEQLESLRGPAGEDGSVSFEDLTPEQRESLRGPRGYDGAPGAGVSTGGSVGQVLYKVTDADYNTGWKTIREVPTGGTNGQVLTSNGNDGMSWTTVSGGGGMADPYVGEVNDEPTLALSSDSNDLKTDLHFQFQNINSDGPAIDYTGGEQGIVCADRFGVVDHSFDNDGKEYVTLGITADTSNGRDGNPAIAPIIATLNDGNNTQVELYFTGGLLTRVRKLTA